MSLRNIRGDESRNWSDLLNHENRKRRIISGNKTCGRFIWRSGWGAGSVIIMRILLSPNDWSIFFLCPFFWWPSAIQSALESWINYPSVSWTLRDHWMTSPIWRSSFNPSSHSWHPWRISWFPYGEYHSSIILISLSCRILILSSWSQMMYD